MHNFQISQTVCGDITISKSWNCGAYFREKTIHSLSNVEKAKALQQQKLKQA